MAKIKARNLIEEGWKEDKAIVLVSGGLDSAVVLAEAVQKHGHEHVIALSLYYGQKHGKELQCAEWLSHYYDVAHEVIDLSEVFENVASCSLLQNSSMGVPEGTYSSQLELGVPNTYVPFRNGLFIACAAAIADALGVHFVYYGAHQDDVEAAYPDCSIKFYEAMERAVEVGTEHHLIVVAPFIRQHKADIVKRGIELDVPFAHTWSCYNGGDKPCGKCGTCLDRAKAFAANGIADPALSSK